jgi:PAS domain S-box-containing protein
MNPPDSLRPTWDALLMQHAKEILDSSRDAVLSCRGDGTVFFANGAAERLTGWTREEMVGRKLGTDLHLFPTGVTESWERSARNGWDDRQCAETTTSIKTRLAESKPCLVRIVPIRDGEGQSTGGFSCSLGDLEEPWKLKTSAEVTLREYRTFVERSSDVVFTLGPDLSVRSVNSAAKSVLGYDPEELIGRQIELPFVLPPEEIRRLNGIGAAAIFSEGIRNKLFRIRRKSGVLFWGLVTVFPVLDDGAMGSLLGVLRDVSEFYETREQVEYQHAQLKRTVSQLEEAYRLQEQFVANVTHELRTPLTTILITSEVLERAAHEGWPAAQRRQVELVHKNSKVLLDIINDLLDLAKLKRAGFKLSLQEVRLRQFLGEQMEGIEPLFAQKNLDLLLEVSPEVPEDYRTDPAILRKVITNMLSNAFKFTEQGGAVVRVCSSEEALRISVSDTGIGIAPEDLPRIFEEFRQLDGSDSRHYPGTGLGLAIAERFTKLLGGRLEVESKPRVGTTFTLILPNPAAGDPPSSLL